MARGRKPKTGAEDFYPDFDGHSEPSKNPVSSRKAHFIQVGTAAPVTFDPVSPNQKSGTADIGDRGEEGSGRR